MFWNDKHLYMQERHKKRVACAVNDAKSMGLRRPLCSLLRRPTPSIVLPNAVHPLRQYHSLNGLVLFRMVLAVGIEPT